MHKIYYLSSCSTCARIMKELKISAKNFILQDIKTEKITSNQLEEMKKLSGSYESLFSRIALKYKSLGLKDKNLTENDYKKYILDEYTFLKRPVMLLDNAIFIGNSKSVIAQVAKALH